MDFRIKSFARRSGRVTRGQERALVEGWEIYGLDKAIGPQIWANGAILEIGFGNGQSLLSMAIASPTQHFIGVEVHKPGVGALIASIQEQGVTNIRVYHDDAIDVLNQGIADASLSRVQLYFPDPWPKIRHHKRRLVRPDFVQLVRQKLQPNGVFHLATDWENYAEHMLETLDQAEGFINQAGKGQFSPRPDYRPLTRFEERGQKMGHGIWDLLYLKTS